MGILGETHMAHGTDLGAPRDMGAALRALEVRRGEPHPAKAGGGFLGHEAAAGRALEEGDRPLVLLPRCRRWRDIMDPLEVLEELEEGTLRVGNLLEVRAT